jgi:type I restriction enzyme S subunit
MVHDGDFLLSNSMSFGRPYIMRTSGCIHDGWLVLSNYQDRLFQDYLYHLLGSATVYRQFDNLAAGSTVRNLNIELASRVAIPVPPLDLQQDIASEIEILTTEIQRLTQIYERKLAALEELKTSFLHQAFNGEL